MRTIKLYLLEATHEPLKSLNRAGAVVQVTIRKFGQMNVPPVSPLKLDEIKSIRENSHVSQAVLACLLNTSLSTVQKWEIDQKRPAGTALKPLHLVQKHGLKIITT